MHPLDGGTALLKCNLNYERLTVAQMQARIQACLDQTQNAEPDKWLEVVNWFREAMLPNGVATTRATLDVLKTRRPVFVMSSFGHTALVNTRALQLAKITVATPDPLGGRIDRDSSGAPTGILEGAAFKKVAEVIPKPTPAEDRRAASAALEAMRKQGITTFLDAMATPRTLAAFAAVQKEGTLTARAHFAVLITPEQGRDPKQAVAVANRIVSQQIKLVDGHACSGSSIPASEVYADNSVLMMSPASSNPVLTEKGHPTIMRIYPRDDAQGAFIAPWIADQFKGKTIAILHDKSAYGKGLATVVKDKLNAAGLANAAFGLIGDRVVVVSERPVAGLDEGEVEQTVRHLAAVADTFDDRLEKDFGATRA